MDNSPAQTVPDVPRLLRSNEVAEICRVSTETVGRWARAGKIKSVIGPSGRRMYPSGQLAALLDPDGAAAADEPQAVAS